MEFGQTIAGLTYAYRPHEVLTTEGPRALRLAEALFEDYEHHPKLDNDTIGPDAGKFYRLTHVDDPILLIEELQLRGIVAQPNHVFFAHDSLQGNPVYGSPVYGSPVYGSPVYGSPVYGSPVYGSPVYGAGAIAPPAYGTELFGEKSKGTVHTEPNRSSALPQAPRTPKHTIETLEARIGTSYVPGSPNIIVLDTGLAAPAFRPTTLGTGIRPATALDVDEPTHHNDGYLDPTAGHGTFIAGVIAQIASGCEITIHKVLSTFGDGDEWVVSQVIDSLAPPDPHRTILSLSFGGYVLERPHLMARTIRKIQHTGVQVVASAGNDATSTPTYPAALPDVLGVGALSPTGPAYFTNYGPWVEACAPGYDLLSTFFRNFNGPDPVDDYGEDPDHFTGWALWSGTSFAGPVVVGNLARLMMFDAPTTKAAMDRLINSFSLTTIALLGTIVDFM